MDARKILSDPAMWLIIISNLGVIWYTYSAGWNFFDVFAVFWLQTIIIIVFHYLKLSDYKRVFVPENHDFLNKQYPKILYQRESGMINRQKFAKEIAKATFKTYFIFEGFYLFFILFIAFIFKLFEKSVLLNNFNIDFVWVFVIFFAAHAVSYFLSKKSGEKIDLDHYFQVNNLRIIPMHISIMLGLFLGPYFALVIFVGLKAFIDVAGHIIEHKGDGVPDPTFQWT